MRLRWSRLARDDLSAILEYLSLKNPLAARRFVVRIDSLVQRITRHPESAQNVVERRGVRRIPLIRFSYALFYRVLADEIVILRIIHGAKDRPWAEIEKI